LKDLFYIVGLVCKCNLKEKIWEGKKKGKSELKCVFYKNMYIEMEFMGSRGYSKETRL